jgi:hypothetical protein
VLTDDDLTRQLGAAFEDATRDTTYDGAVPRVRTRPAWVAPGWVALPAAGAVAAAVLVMGSTGDTTSPSTPEAAPGTTTSAPSATGASPTSGGEDTVTETFELAGMTFTYERGADETSIDDQFLRVYDPGQLPGWAQPVELEQGASAKVWVGQDPSTGDVSMFVQSPERWDGALVGLASPTTSVEQMTRLAQTGRLS